MTHKAQPNIPEHNKSDAGFTIVELLIVIVVIGILAAITIVAYVNFQGRAVSARLQTDAENSAKQIAIDQVTNGQYPATVSMANNGKGLPKSPGTTYQYTVNNTTTPQTFCLSITDLSSPTGYYVNSTNNSPTVGLCPGDVQNPPSGTLPVITSPPAGNQGFSWYLDLYGTVLQIGSSGSGTPAPTMQWQVMTKNTTTGSWSNISGAGATTANLTWDFGSLYAAGDYALFRVIYTNSAGSTTSPTMKGSFSYGG